VTHLIFEHPGCEIIYLLALKAVVCWELVCVQIGVCLGYFHNILNDLGKAKLIPLV
jgi:hypothetical protein